MLPSNPRLAPSRVAPALLALALGLLAIPSGRAAGWCDEVEGMPEDHWACTEAAQVPALAATSAPPLLPGSPGPQLVQQYQSLVLLKKTWDYMSRIGDAPETLGIERARLDALLDAFTGPRGRLWSYDWMVGPALAKAREAAAAASGGMVGVDAWALVVLETVASFQAAGPPPGASAARPRRARGDAPLPEDVPAGHWAAEAVRETVARGFWDWLVDDRMTGRASP